MENKNKEDHASFMARFQLKITPSDQEKLDYAYDMAKYGHRNQFRESGERYFEHLRATALILVDELGVTDVELIISALLHDMLEDSFLLTPERIKITFGERVARIVTVTTKPKKGELAFASDHERHLWYFEQIKGSEIDAKIIKLADRLHNMRTLGSCSTEKQRRKINETKNIYLPLIKEVEVQYPPVAKKLEEKFKQALAGLEKDLGQTA